MFIILFIYLNFKHETPKQTFWTRGNYIIICSHCHYVFYLFYASSKLFQFWSNSANTDCCHQRKIMRSSCMPRPNSDSIQKFDHHIIFNDKSTFFYHHVVFIIFGFINLFIKNLKSICFEFSKEFFRRVIWISAQILCDHHYGEKSNQKPKIERSLKKTEQNELGRRVQLKWCLERDSK